MKILATATMCFLQAAACTPGHAQEKPVPPAAAEELSYPDLSACRKIEWLTWDYPTGGGWVIYTVQEAGTVRALADRFKDGKPACNLDFFMIDGDEPVDQGYLIFHLPERVFVLHVRAHPTNRKAVNVATIQKLREDTILIGNPKGLSEFRDGFVFPQEYRSLLAPIVEKGKYPKRKVSVERVD